MPWWRRKRPADPASFSLDEFVGDGDGREASPLELSRNPQAWQDKLTKVARRQTTPRELALSAFTLIRGGDLFESNRRPAPTPDDLLSRYASERLRLSSNGASQEVQDVALQGVLRVVEGNPAVCLRMMLAKPISVVIIPQGDDFRRYGFPANTNPRAAGIFYNRDQDDEALIGLREELILDKAWLMVHEMTHAVHLMGMTKKEREDIEALLVPVYRSRRWVEAVVAIYAERAFGAQYTDLELNAPDLYGKTRREWTDRAVFSLFMSELLRPRGQSMSRTQTPALGPRGT